MTNYKILVFIAALLNLAACSVPLSAPTTTLGANNLDQEDNWLLIPKGQFLMGASSDDQAANSFEKPQHTVKVTKTFKMSRYEVTFGQYEQFAKATHRPLPNDVGFQESQHELLPVINVSWDDANAYAEWLSKQTGKHFRLPTEAEWEYAARAGTIGKRFWGENPDQACQFANVFDRRNEAKIRERFSVPKTLIGNYNCEDAYFATAPVGSFKPNPWGLHDMLGNVWEWVQDCQHNNYINAPTEAHIAWQADNGGNCTKRGVRGGSWFVAVPYVCSAYRSWNAPTDKGTGIGFRLIQDEF